MKLPASFAPALFVTILSGCMALIMSTTLTLARVGFAPGVPEEVLHNAAFAYPVALVVSLFLTPIVRWFVQQITEAQPAGDKRPSGAKRSNHRQDHVA